MEFSALRVRASRLPDHRTRSDRAATRADPVRTGSSSAEVQPRPLLLSQEFATSCALWPPATLVTSWPSIAVVNFADTALAALETAAVALLFAISGTMFCAANMLFGSLR